jgi:hypothetical protein
MKHEINQEFLVVDVFFLSSGRKILAVENFSEQIQSNLDEKWELIFPGRAPIPVALMGEHVIRGQTKLLNCKAIEIDGSFTSKDFENGKVVLRQRMPA